MDLKLIFWITCRVGIISDILSPVMGTLQASCQVCVKINRI